MSRVLQPNQCAELYIVDVLTGERSLRYRSKTLLFEAPNWSPDGQSLYINGDGLLFRLPVGETSPEGPDLTQVDLGDIPPINNDHVLSPDGEFVYVSADDGHIYGAELNGESQRRVTNDHGPQVQHYLHGISPDGQTLAYIGVRDEQPVTINVFTIPAQGGQDVQLTNDHYPDDGAEFSADGQWIYFNSERGSNAPGHAQLFKMPAAGGTPEQLTFDERVNWFPHPSPQNDSIAYVSFPPGTLGHPEDVDVIVRLLETDGKITDLAHVFGGQGTMNVPSWDPSGSKVAIVAYPVHTDNKR